MMQKSPVYSLQNRAIHTARRQLEEKGILDPQDGLNQIRQIAARINAGIASISRLSLEQRRILIDELIDVGAQVKNPHLYESDFRAEAGQPGKKRKVLIFSRVTEKQLRMIDALADQIHWPAQDSFERFCYKLFDAPRPRNLREVTRIAVILRSMIERQTAGRRRASGVPEWGDKTWRAKPV